MFDDRTEEPPCLPESIPVPEQQHGFAAGTLNGEPLRDALSQLGPHSIEIAAESSLLFANGTFCEMVGYSFAELVDASPAELLDEVADVLEVLRGIAVASGTGWNEVEERAAAKRDERGGFVEGVWLVATD